MQNSWLLFAGLPSYAIYSTISLLDFFWGETKLYLPCTIFFVDELSLLLQPTDFLTRKVKYRHRTILSLILVHSVRRLLDYSAAVSLDKHKSNISIEVSAIFLSFYLALLLQFLYYPFQQFIELSYKTHTFFNWIKKIHLVCLIPTDCSSQPIFLLLVLFADTENQAKLLLDSSFAARFSQNSCVWIKIVTFFCHISTCWFKIKQ